MLHKYTFSHRLSGSIIFSDPDTCFILAPDMARDFDQGEKMAVIKFKSYLVKSNIKEKTHEEKHAGTTDE